MIEAENIQVSTAVEQIVAAIPEQCRGYPRTLKSAHGLEWVVQLQRISPAQAATLIIERSTCLISTETY